VETAERPTARQKRGSGGQGRAPEPRFLAIGQVIGVHGVRGELKVEILTDDPQRFGLLKEILVGLEDQEPVPWVLEGYRLHQGRALLKLRGCDDRVTAETLRGYLLQVRLEDALPLEEGEYFEYQIVGLEVWTAAGEHLGEVMEILHTGANDVYVVQGIGPDRRGGRGPREILIPALEDVVLEVDLEDGRLVVELPEGLL
jgi:16S rRNA processing protein RimM